LSLCSARYPRDKGCHQVMVMDAHVYGSPSKDMSSAAPNGGQWPGTDDIDNEWVYIRDEALGLTRSFEYAVSFASQ
jgi:hypothetical protein